MKFLTNQLSDRIQRKYLLLEPIYAMTSNGKKAKEQIKLLHEYAEKMISERAHNGSNSENVTDLIDIMLNTTKSDGKLMNDEEIKDEVINMGSVSRILSQVSFFCLIRISHL